MANLIVASHILQRGFYRAARLCLGTQKLLFWVLGLRRCMSIVASCGLICFSTPCSSQTTPAAIPNVVPFNYGPNILRNSDLGVTTALPTVFVGKPISVSSWKSTTEPGAIIISSADSVSGHANGVVPGKLFAMMGPNPRPNLHLTGVSVTNNIGKPEGLIDTLSGVPSGSFSGVTRGDIIWNTGGTNTSPRGQCRVLVVSDDGSRAALQMFCGYKLKNEYGVSFDLVFIQRGSVLHESVNGMPEQGNDAAPGLWAYPLQAIAVNPGSFVATLSGWSPSSLGSATAQAWEMTTGDTGIGTGQAADWWRKAPTLRYYKMRGYDWDGTTVVNKPGALYSAKLVKGTTETEDMYYDLAASSPAATGALNAAGLEKARGKKLTCGAYLWPKAERSVRLYAFDGSSRKCTDSSKCSDFARAGSYQWVEFSPLFSLAATAAHVGIEISGNVGDTVFVTQPICVYGDGRIGEGNYRAAPPALTMFTNHMNPFYYAGRSVPTSRKINIEQETAGTLPSGLQAIQTDIEGRNSALTVVENGKPVETNLFLSDIETSPTTSALTLYPQVVGKTIVNTMTVGVGKYQYLPWVDFTTDVQYIKVNNETWNITMDYLGAIY